MTWSWSHTTEAYDALRQTIAKQERTWLETVFAEWCSKPGGAFGPRENSSSTGDFDERMYNRGLARAKVMSSEELAEKIYNFAERQALCTNGGWEAWCCPYGCGCHTLEWGKAEDDAAE